MISSAEERDKASEQLSLGHRAEYGDALESCQERDWVLLVNLIAAGDQRALRQLFERTHRLVFSLLVRLTHSRDVADDLTVAVFHDVWRSAAEYDPATGSVVSWLMRQARAKALARLRFERELDSDILTSTTFLWGAIAKSIISESGLLPVFTAPQGWAEPEWHDVAPGLSCKVLAMDEQHERVTMLVRLAAGAEYPAHTHTGVEELHVLHGELLIDRRKLGAGAYNRTEPGSAHHRMSSAVGCTCLVITSPRDKPS
jgi:DNA-directed RNA polymerase specialized sigma24 family protein